MVRYSQDRVIHQLEDEMIGDNMNMLGLAHCLGFTFGTLSGRQGGHATSGPAA